jgi:hypothetical protein
VREEKKRRRRWRRGAGPMPAARRALARKKTSFTRPSHTHTHTRKDRISTVLRMMHLFLGVFCLWYRKKTRKKRRKDRLSLTTHFQRCAALAVSGWA